MKKRAIAVAVGLAISVGSKPAGALPTGGEVTAGQGTIGSPSNGSLVVTQQSNHLAIDWLKFGIGSAESVHFAQPSASAIALNRVLGNEASHIYGRLSANGQVFLLNPNGVLFAPGSQVNVGGLVASTLSLSNEGFLAGRFVFKKEKASGAVVNRGEITAGYAALLGPQVSNEGVITATLGTVALAAGEQITLNLNGTSLVGLSVDKGSLDALAANKQLIRADGGTVILTAKATDDILRNVVNNDGIIEARALSARDGVIRLEGSGSGIVSVDGTLKAKNITVTGDKVGLYENARLEAPGGTILVGGNFQGKGPERNSTATYVASGAVLNADAVGEGDGGTVIVWSDGITRFHGHLSSRGGPEGGDGGFAEISGKGQLIYRGSADLAAARGRPGKVLFDPRNITIADAGADAVATNNEFAENAGSDVTFDASSITSITSAGTPVTLQASNDITVDEAIITSNGSGDGGAIALQAGRSIRINQSITTDNGNLTLIANESLANGVVDAQRDVGSAVITAAPAAVVNVGTGTMTVTMRLGDDKTFFDAGEITLGQTSAGTLSVTNAGNSFNSRIVQVGAITVTGIASFTATDDVLLLLTTNDFQGLVNLASTRFNGSHTITDANHLQLGNISIDPVSAQLVSQTGGGGVTGHLTQTSPIQANRLWVRTFGPDSDILLDQANQLADSLAPFAMNSFGAGSWRDVSLRNTTSHSSWRLNPAGAWLPMRNLTIHSASPIRQQDPLRVSQVASFNAGNNPVVLNDAANEFQGRVDIPAAASVDLRNQSSLTLGSINASGTITAHAGADLAIANGATVASNASGNAIVLAAANNFVNNAGAGALSVPGTGRWLVYSTSPAGSTENGLTGAADPTTPRLYNRTFAGNPPASIAAGNHLIYSAQPLLTVTANNATRAYGYANPAFTFNVSGLVNDDGYADTLVLGGAVSFTTPANAASTPGAYPITPAGLTSPNYVITFVDGVLTVISQAYNDTLAGIQGNRVVAPLPVEYHSLVTIENGGMRLFEGMKP